MKDCLVECQDGSFDVFIDGATDAQQGGINTAAYVSFSLIDEINRHASMQWCFDPNLMPPGNIPEAECPDCDKPISKCTCNNAWHERATP